MASPFSFFRKHSLALLVSLGVIAILSFVVGPSIMDYQSTRRNPGALADDAVVTWSGGAIRETDLRSMRISHNLVVEFLSSVVQDTIARKGTPRGLGVRRDMFGRIVDPGISSSDADEDLVRNLLLARKAESMGLVVSDEAVFRFLDELSDGTIPRGDLTDVFRNSVGNRISDQQLIQQLRRELLAQNMLIMVRAGLFVLPPAKAWQYHNRLHHRVKAEIIPLEVADFKSKLNAGPTDAQVEALYQEGKDRFPDPDQPEAGFKRRRKIALQYVKADFNQFLKEEIPKVTGGITDEDIEKHYQENKEKYKEEEEAGAAAKQDSSSTESKSEGDTAPATDSNSSSAKPDGREGDGAARNPVPGAEMFFVSTSAGSQEPEATKPAGQSSDAGSGASQTEGEDKPRPTEQAPKKKEKEDVDADKDADKSESASRVGGDPGKKPAPDAASAKSDAAPAKEDEGGGPSKAKETAETKYKPLDDPLRQQIRQELADARARKPAQDRLDAALAQIRSKLDKYANGLARYNDLKDINPNLRKPEPVDVEQLAGEQGLTVGDVPLVDALAIEDYELGRAFDTVFDSWPPRRVSFPELAYREGIPLYKPSRIKAEELDIEFLYWKVEEEPPYVPALAEIRDEVVDAWKQREALAVAKSEAERLAKKARQSGKSLKETFAGEGGLSVAETNHFSWMSTGFSPAGMGTPGLSNVDGVEGAGTDFMRAIFALKEGEVGVAINQPQTVVYVVRIASASPSEDMLRDQFLESGVTYEISLIAAADIEQLYRDWYQNLEDEFDVKWVRQPGS